MSSRFALSLALALSVAVGCNPSDEDNNGTADAGTDTVSDVSDDAADDTGTDVSTDADDDPEVIDPTLDTDGDGVTDADEIQKWGTNPLVADTDGDGLNDGFELAGWDVDDNGTTSRYSSDPTIADTDLDGTADAKEYADGTNPAEALPDAVPSVTNLDFTTNGTGATITADVASPNDQVVRVEVDWGDGSAVQLIEGTDLTSIDQTNAYATVGSYTISVTPSSSVPKQTAAAAEQALTSSPNFAGLSTTYASSPAPSASRKST